MLAETLQKLSNDKVQIRVLHAGVGAIRENDVNLASSSDAIIIGFNVRPERKAAELAELEKVDIRLHTIIYELTDEIRKAMVGMLNRSSRKSIRAAPKCETPSGSPKWARLQVATCRTA